MSAVDVDFLALGEAFRYPLGTFVEGLLAQLVRVGSWQPQIGDAVPGEGLLIIASLLTAVDDSPDAHTSEASDILPPERPADREVFADPGEVQASGGKLRYPREALANESKEVFGESWVGYLARALNAWSSR